MEHSKKVLFYFFGLFMSLLLIAVDQVTKYLAIIHLKDQENFVIIKNVLEFEYLENRGAAFSILQGQREVFIVLTVVAVILLLWEYFKIPSGKRYLLLKGTFILLLAGAIGNVIDRIWRQYVVDFIYFKPINFPRFNLADSYMTVAIVLLVIATLFYYKEEEVDFLFHIKKKKEEQIK